MNKLLFTCLSGLPSENMGGAHRIILELMKKMQSSEFRIGYLSSHYSNDKITEDEILRFIQSNVNLLNNIRKKLFYKNHLYRNVVTNPFYWNFHLLKCKISFSKTKNRFNNFDLIHSHDVLSLFFLRNMPQPKILSIHSKGIVEKDIQDSFGNHKLFSYQRATLNKMENLSFEIANIVTFPSKAAKNFFLESKGMLDSKKIAIVYNGIDLQKIGRAPNNLPILGIEENARERDKILLLNIAEHIKPKNIDKALLIVKLLKSRTNKKIVFLNVGKGPQTTYLKELVEEYNIEKNVFFYSYLPNNDIISLMKKFDFLLSLSERVIFDMVILEALACGMIVIASNVGGNREVIQHGQNGYLLDIQRINEIVDVILNPKTEIKNNARKTGMQFGTNNMTQAYKTLYHKAILER